MIFRITIYSLLFLSSFLTAQITTDTVDYKNVFQTYRLRAIQEQKKEVPVKDEELFFAKIIATEGDLKTFTNFGVKCIKNDTVINMEWDITRLQKDHSGHCVGKGSIHTSLNKLVIMKSIRRVSGTFKIVKREFKILKLTASELILFDITNVDLRRTFYFSKI